MISTGRNTINLPLFFPPQETETKLRLLKLFYTKTKYTELEKKANRENSIFYKYYSPKTISIRKRTSINFMVIEKNIVKGPYKIYTTSNNLYTKSSKILHPYVRP